jgi:hypothetical protein
MSDRDALTDLQRGCSRAKLIEIGIRQFVQSYSRREAA